MTLRVTQEDLDLLADIIWWIKGYKAADHVGCPFEWEHVEALSKARRSLQVTDDSDVLSGERHS